MAGISRVSSLYCFDHQARKPDSASQPCFIITKQIYITQDYSFQTHTCKRASLKEPCVSVIPGCTIGLPSTHTRGKQFLMLAHVLSSLRIHKTCQAFEMRCCTLSPDNMNNAHQRDNPSCSLRRSQLPNAWR